MLSSRVVTQTLRSATSRGLASGRSGSSNGCSSNNIRSVLLQQYHQQQLHCNRLIPHKQHVHISCHTCFTSASASSLSLTARSKPIHHRDPFTSSSGHRNNQGSFLSSRSLFTVKIQRDSRFSVLTAQDLGFFEKLLGPAGVIKDTHDLEIMNRDWIGNWQGQSKLALRPKSTEEVSKILAYCNQKKLAVVPQGGNTGLVGGSVPVFDEIILSTSRMNRVISLDENSGVLVCEAGAVLEKLSQYLDERGFVMPLDLGAKGSCQIGGNAATNAGGIRFVRYGSLRGNILGMEMVLPDGTIVDSLSTLRKDNTGYDLKQLFIGSEGTLGVITKLSILVPRKPIAVQVALFGLNSFEDVLKVHSVVRTRLGEILSAIEFMDESSVRYVLKYLPNAQYPMSNFHPFYVLVETSGSKEDVDAARLLELAEHCSEAKLIQDAIFTQGTRNLRDVWKLREGIAEAMNRAGTVYKYDLSIPLSDMYNIVTNLRKQLSSFPEATAVGYGHLGDGNLHVNVSVPKHDEKVLGGIEPYIFEEVSKLRGSVSAEHGIGQCKVDYLSFSKSKESIVLMQKIKTLFDPNGIMNPYKLFSSTKK